MGRNKMKNTSNFWNYYSNVYDLLNQFYPYQKHLDLIYDLSAPQAGKLYLDAGCGTGNLAIKLSQAGANVIGVDYSDAMLVNARKKNKKIQFEFADLDAPLKFADNFFDGVASNHVIAFLKEPKNTLTEIYRILKPGAMFVAATLKDHFSPVAVYKEHLKHKGWLHTFRTILPLAGLSIASAVILKRIREGTYHVYNEKTFLCLLEQSGFTNIKILSSYTDQDLVAICRK